MCQWLLCLFLKHILVLDDGTIFKTNDQVAVEEVKALHERGGKINELLQFKVAASC